MSEKQEHSPLPWSEEGPYNASIYDANGRMIAAYIALEDKRLIITAANAYPGLVEENKRLRAELERVASAPWVEVSTSYRMSARAALGDQSNG